MARLLSDPVFQAEEAAREAAAVKERAEEEERERVRTRASRRSRAMVPPRVFPYLDAPLETEAILAVRRFMDSKLTFLVLAGGVGCGKTIAACAALDQRSGGMFLKAAAVMRTRFDDQLWKAVLAATILVVDDLGTEPLDAKGWGAGAFAELFDARYDWEAPTILTTNLGAKSFKERYCEQDGGRFVSRLRETGRFEEIASASLRRAAP